MVDSVDDPRLELARVAASLRAYLEWQVDTGAHGIPRRPAGARAAVSGAPPTAARAASAQERHPEHDVDAAPPAAISSEHVVEAPSIAAAVASVAPAPASAGAPQAPTASAHAPAAANVDPKVRLPQIEEEVRTCTRCTLAPTRTKTVFSRGNPEANLCFIGEAPGADEDAQGIPFVGRAGQLLDKMIAAMGLRPEHDVYVCNIIKCRPPGNRRPTPEETAACIPYLHEQLALVSPKVIVAMGNTAVGTLLDTKVGITKLRGQWKLYKGRVLVMPTYHPSYLIRPSAQQAEAKRQAWEDLQAVMKELKIPLPARGAKKT